MRQEISYCTFLLMGCLFLSSCATVPISGRRQIDFIPSSMMLAMSFQQYDEFLKENKISQDRRQTELVNNVGRNIQKAVETYMANNNMSDRLNNYKWEFNLVESEEINAWCMSGGKVVVYTGILPITKDETGLAVVIGHEVAHAVARHGDERMSHILLTELGGLTLQAALKEKPQETQQLWSTAFGIGSQVGFLLPYSRLQESEADRLGLIFMAMAGYNPNKAIDFWGRMFQAHKSGRPPEFLSTHPTDEKRIQQIKSYIPEALTYYKK